MQTLVRNVFTIFYLVTNSTYWSHRCEQAQLTQADHVKYESDLKENAHLSNTKANGLGETGFIQSSRMAETLKCLNWILDLYLHLQNHHFKSEIRSEKKKHFPHDLCCSHHFKAIWRGWQNISQIRASWSVCVNLAWRPGVQRCLFASQGSCLGAAWSRRARHEINIERVMTCPNSKRSLRSRVACPPFGLGLIVSSWTGHVIATFRLKSSHSKPRVWLKMIQATAVCYWLQIAYFIGQRWPNFFFSNSTCHTTVLIWCDRRMGRHFTWLIFIRVTVDFLQAHTGILSVIFSIWYKRKK